MFTYLGNDFPSRQLLTAPALLYVVLDRAQVEDYRDRFDQINMIPISEAERSRTLLRALDFTPRLVLYFILRMVTACTFGQLSRIRSATSSSLPVTQNRHPYSNG